MTEKIIKQNITPEKFWEVMERAELLWQDYTPDWPLSSAKVITASRAINNLLGYLCRNDLKLTDNIAVAYRAYFNTLPDSPERRVIFRNLVMHLWNETAFKQARKEIEKGIAALGPIADAIRNFR